MRANSIVAALVISVTAVQPALAQTCACSGAPVDELIANADYAFVGLSLGTMHVDDCFIHREGDGPWMTRFQLLESQKGNFPDGKVLVRHDEDARFCGIRFLYAQAYLVAGKINNKGQPTTDKCSVVSMPEEK